MTTLLINVVFSVFLTTLTGAIMFLFWCILEPILERMGYAHIVFELLKVVVLSFLLPIAYIFVKCFEMELGKGFLMSPTPNIVSSSRVLTSVWITGVIVVFLYLFFDMLRVTCKYCRTFPCSRDAQAVFDELKGDLLSSRSPLQLRQCYSAEVPFSVGVFWPRVVLVVKRYMQEELRIILLHEMMHYKQRDLPLKLMVRIALAFHWFNPCAWFLFIIIRNWSEYACDLKVSKYVDNKLAYFEVIIRFLMDDPQESGLTSQLVMNQHELTKRAKKLMRISKMKKRSTFSMILVLCAAFMLSSTSVYAATEACADAYITMEKITSEESIQLQSVTVTGDMAVEYGPSDGITVVEGELQQHQGRTTYGFEWDVPAGYRIYTPWFDCEAGDTLVVTVLVDPTNISARVGLEDSMGYRYYVVGADTIAHSYDITASGEYRVYVQNNTSSDFSVSGTYIIR